MVFRAVGCSDILLIEFWVLFGITTRCMLLGGDSKVNINGSFSFSFIDRVLIERYDQKYQKYPQFTYSIANLNFI